MILHYREEIDDQPICPVCGRECESIYIMRKTHEIIGCDMDIREFAAYRVDECFLKEEND